MNNKFVKMIEFRNTTVISVHKKTFETYTIMNNINKEANSFSIF